ncbi:hypothetical protein CDD83_2899 [Cordyceps sp. RAO-2017]|nr:hypothetical protein CDD83_2899 [Cordyceps sp. RAO-2017]
MARHAVPTSGSTLRISNPVPDMLYGYKRGTAFRSYQAQLATMGTEKNGTANNQGLMFPFFVVEFEGDGPTGGGTLWAATNQCLNASASCINIVQSLNRQLRECKNRKGRQIDSAAFSVAMSGTEARLFVSWEENDVDFCTRQVGGFLLQRPDDFLEFRKQVLNIIDWGADGRLRDIRDCLEVLVEEGRARASDDVGPR